MLRKLLSAIFFLQTVVLTNAGAQVPSEPRDAKAYLALTDDLWDELATMDAVTEPLELRALFTKKMKAYLTDPRAEDPTRETGPSWSGLMKSYLPGLLGGESTPATQNFEKITTASIQGAGRHAIHDVDGYVKNRLGSHTAETLRRGELAALVYGGDIDSAMSYLGVEASSVFHLPSFYERWGIAKYLISGQKFKDKVPRLVIIVPPAKRYLEHYRTMLDQVGAKNSEVILDHKDLEAYRRRLRNAVRRISSRLGQKVDYAALGYYGQWVQVLQELSSPWELRRVSVVVASGIEGISGRELTVRLKSTGVERVILLLSSDKTIWGESSAFIAEGLLDLDLRGLFFMGSAGGVSARMAVYDVSAPARFALPERELGITNVLAEVDGAKAGVPIVIGARHGNTYSPIEQSENYLRSQLAREIDTIDVEQSLIAEKVENSNRESGYATAFGAVNVITDLPGQFIHGKKSEHDLDNVNSLKKSQARLAAVRLALLGMVELEKQVPSALRKAQ